MTMEINHGELEEVVRKSYLLKKPLMVMGAVGIGKSMTVREQAKELAEEEDRGYTELESEYDGEHFFLKDIRISQYDPSDLKGLPKQDDHRTTWLKPKWLPRDEEAKGIIFFDEINLAPPNVQAPAYQLILQRQLGDYHLPDGVLVIGAGNRLKDRANVFEMSSALRDRFAIYELGVPTAKEWIRWARENDIDSRVISFLRYQRKYLYEFDPDMKVFPTPRSWEQVSDLIQGLEYDSYEQIKLLAGGYVSRGIGVEFANFLKLREKIDIEKVLENPRKAKLPEETSLRWSLVSAIIDRYVEASNTRSEVLLQKILGLALNLKAEFGAFLLRQAKAEKEQFWKYHQDDNKDLWNEIVDRYDKFLLSREYFEP